MVADMLSAHNSSTEIDFDRAIAIGAEHADLALPQSSHDFRMWMAEQVVPPAGDHREARLDGIEEDGSGGAAAAVMGDFQDVRPQVPFGQLPFRFAFDVAGEEDAGPLELHAQDDR